MPAVSLDVDFAAIPHLLILGLTGSTKTRLAQRIVADVLASGSPGPVQRFGAFLRQSELPPRPLVSVISAGECSTDWKRRFPALTHIKVSAKQEDHQVLSEHLRLLAQEIYERSMSPNLRSWPHRLVVVDDFDASVDSLNSEQSSASSPVQKQLIGTMINIARRGRASKVHLLVLRQHPEVPEEFVTAGGVTEHLVALAGLPSLQLMKSNLGS